MVLAILAVLVIWVFDIIWIIDDREPLSQFGMAVGGVLAGAIVWLFSTFWSDMLPLEEYQLQEVNYSIVALQDNNVTSGHFILGCGTVEGKLTYYYMRDTDKGYIVNSINASEVYLREDDNEEPHLATVYSTGFKHWYTYILNVPYTTIYRVIYVPSNTIYKNYNVDLK